MTLRVFALQLAAICGKIDHHVEICLDLARDNILTAGFAHNSAVTVKLTKDCFGAAGKELDFEFHGAKRQFSEA